MASPQEVEMSSATGVAVARPVPSECDVCHGKLADTDEYRPMTIIRDSTPRRLRERSGGGFIEDEWRIDVCTRCNERFEVWLFGDPHESDTIPAPAGDALDSPVLGATLGVEVVPVSDSAGGVDTDQESESAPFASVPPNRS
jgi:hypothetical protein